MVNTMAIANAMLCTLITIVSSVWITKIMIQNYKDQLINKIEQISKIEQEKVGGKEKEK